jgi:hypothetical protein
LSLGVDIRMGHKQSRFLIIPEAYRSEASAVDCCYLEKLNPDPCRSR